MKSATNVNQTIAYTTITSLEVPAMKVAIDSDGNRFDVHGDAMVGDVLVFPTDTTTPICMPLELFQVGRTLS